MKRSTLQDYCAQKWKQVAAFTRAYAEKQDPEALHKLRVEIKKLNLAFELMDFCPGKHKEPFGKPLKKLFRHAGAIRTAQVNGELLSAFHIADSTLASHQAMIATAETLRFCWKEEAYQKEIKKKQETFQNRIPSIPNHCAIAFCEGQTAGLSRIFATPPEPSSLHESRKLLKKLLYLKALFSDSVWQGLSLDGEYIDELQESIGKWHDAVLVIELLSASENGSSLPEELKKQEQFLLEAVLEKTRDFPVRVRAGKV
ncbi:MAG: CHAD domain-containing protein [Flavisolibacter sp.]